MATRPIPLTTVYTELPAIDQHELSHEEDYIMRQI